MPLKIRMVRCDIINLFEMEKRHFWHIVRREIIYDNLKAFSGKMLEVGCGNGNVLSFLRKKGMDVDGADIDAESLANCKHREPNANLYLADICYLALKDKYDIVGAFDILEHVDDYKALQSIKDLLNSKGKLLITVPAYPSLWSSFDIMAKHIRRYTKDEICTKLENNGYQILRSTCFMTLLFPIIALMRLTRKDTNAVEMKTIPVINEIFLLIFRLERLIIRYVDLPFGSSILILAEKI